MLHAHDTLGRAYTAAELVDELLIHASTSTASDIHIDPSDAGTVVRLRHDGILSVLDTIPAELHDEVIGRIKVLAGLRTDEHILPQDGRFRFTKGTLVYDIRVCMMKTHAGENAVLRLLPLSERPRPLTHLGFHPTHEILLTHIVRRPSGFVLIAGPTGSGKTTTLYSLLSVLDSRSASIVTLEDPVEYVIPGVRHIPIRERLGFTFGAGLRSVLRQDPDVLMVGEIRDAETAALAIHASLTGHMVLSSIHATSAAKAVPRLFDMGVESYLLRATLAAIVSQRLVRMLCSACATETVLDDIEKEYLRAHGLSEGGAWKKAVGCDGCRHTGYSGRTCVYECMPITTRLRSVITSATSHEEVEQIAKDEGMLSFIEDGIAKARQGETSVAELMRVHHDAI